jgi:phosphoribosylformylglycinamidine synthase subunit PurSL
VIRPVLGSNRGLAISCGMNPLYGDIDPYWMAATAIDEAIRNCVAVGADPDRIAILDNFCWGNTDRPEELGKLVRAALACRDIATAYGTPFISGKDSLNNEFRVPDAWRERVHAGPISDDRIVIPPTLLISAIGQIDNVRQCASMDVKEPDNVLCVIGFTANELGGSHFAVSSDKRGGQVPRLDGLPVRRELFRCLHRLIQSGMVRACHDLSEGGLAVAVAEMCFAGGFGAEIHWSQVPARAPLRAMLPSDENRAATYLFSESNTRFLVEVRRSQLDEFLSMFDDEAYTRDGPLVAEVGHVRSDKWLILSEKPGSASDVRLSIDDLKECWQRPLRW